MSDIEIWKEVNGWCGHYEVSNFGNVRSKDRTIQFTASGATRTPRLRGKMLKQCLNPAGYPFVNFSVGGKHKSVMTHRVVLETFVGKPPPGMNACHNDGNKLNNRLDNLRWDTQANNLLDKIKHGTSQHGSRNHMAILSEADVIVIKDRLRSEPRGIGRKLAKEYGVTVSAISAINVGRLWAHLDCASQA